MTTTLFVDATDMMNTAAYPSWNPSSGYPSLSIGPNVDAVDYYTDDSMMPTGTYADLYLKSTPTPSAIPVDSTADETCD